MIILLGALASAAPAARGWSQPRNPALMAFQARRPWSKFRCASCAAALAVLLALASTKPWVKSAAVASDCGMAWRLKLASTHAWCRTPRGGQVFLALRLVPPAAGGTTATSPGVSDPKPSQPLALCEGFRLPVNSHHGMWLRLVCCEICVVYGRPVFRKGGCQT